MKVLVAHPAQQHSYRLAAALHRAGFLDHYATTVYYRPGSLTSLTARLLKGSIRAKAQARRCEEIPDRLVLQFCEGEGLLKLLTMHLPFLRRWYRRVKYHSADRFARRVVKYALRHHVDAVVGYDDYSSVLFTELERRAPHIRRILDVSAANVLYMRQIYEKDMELQPDFACMLRNERKIVWDPNTIERTKRELRSAQLFLVPSEFVAKSLIFSGVSPNQIHVCPYGVDIEKFSPSYEQKSAVAQPLRCIYVGGVKELKGISYLLQAFADIPPETAELTVVGSVDRAAPEVQPYLGRVKFTGPVLHSEMPDLLRAADVFVFPSLGEGQALSVLEAAACGLALVVSEHAGYADRLTDGKEGFVIPIQNAEGIREKIQWLACHREALQGMRKAARAFAEEYSWQRYGMRIIDVFRAIDQTEMEA